MIGWCCFICVLALLQFSACSPQSPPALPPQAVEIPSVATNALDPTLASTIETRRKAVLAAPASADDWGRFGQALDAAEFLPEARTCYIEAARLDPRSARWAHLLGLLQLQEQPDLAISNLTSAAQLSAPTNDAPRLRLAQALVEFGRFSEATNHLMPLLAANPQHAAARLELARVRFAENQTSTASDLLAPCLTNPFTARAGTLLSSQIKARQGEPEAAAALARQAGHMPKPFDWPDSFLREVQGLRADRTRRSDQVNALLLQQRLPDAEAALSNLLQALPEDPEGLLLLGRLRIQQRRCAEAEAILQRLLGVHPDSLNGLVQLGLARYCQSHWKEATAAFEQAVALKPDFAQAHYNLGLAHAQAGDSPGAISSFRQAIRCTPGDPGPWVAMTEEFLNAGKLEDARAGLEHLERLQPRHPAIMPLRDRLRSGR
jgi:tetratricopeptide (TPR) repeat protein